MKKNDIAALILIASISVAVAYFTANALIGAPKQSAQKVDVAEKISPGVTSPDSRIFNKDAINPTVERSIGKSANSLPFE